MRYLGLGALLGTAIALAVRRAVRPSAAPETAWPSPPERESVVDTSVERPAPVPPAPPGQADPADREIESRLDDETKYERFRESEERERAAAAARLQADPLTAPRDTPADPH